MAKYVVGILVYVSTVAVGQGVLLWLKSKGIYPEKWVQAMIGQAESAVLSESSVRWILAGLIGLVGLGFWYVGTWWWQNRSSFGLLGFVVWCAVFGSIFGGIVGLTWYGQRQPTEVNSPRNPNSQETDIDGLRCFIEQTIVGMQGPDTLAILVNMRITNTGPPSIAQNFEITVETAYAKTKLALFTIPHGMSIGPIALGPSDGIMDKTIISPIPTGGGVRGWILGKVVKNEEK